MGLKGSRTYSADGKVWKSKTQFSGGCMKVIEILKLFQVIVNNRQKRNFISRMSIMATWWTKRMISFMKFLCTFLILIMTVRQVEHAWVLCCKVNGLARGE